MGRTSQPTAVESSCLNQERQGQEAEGQSICPSQLILQGWLSYKPFQGPRVRGRAGNLFEGPGDYHSYPKFHLHSYISCQEVKEERRTKFYVTRTKNIKKKKKNTTDHVFRNTVPGARVKILVPP